MEPAVKDALLRMHKRIEELESKDNKTQLPLSTQSKDLDQLFAALCKAQAEFKVAGKGAQGYNFKYADWEEIIAATRPALVANGLNVHQFPLSDSQGNYYIETTIAHESGQYKSGICKVTPDKEGNQGLGAAISYIKRYAYSSAVGLSVANENDVDNYRK